MKTYEFELSTGSTVRVEAATLSEAEKLLWAGLYAVLDAPTVASIEILAITGEG